MTRFAFSNRDRRALVVGATLWLGVLTAWSTPEFIAWQTLIVSRAADASRTRPTLPLDVLRDSVLVLERERLELESPLLRAPSVASATASVGALITALADSSGLRVDGLRSRPGTLANRGYITTSVMLTGTGDIATVASLLTALDTSRQGFAIRAVSILPADVFSSDDVAERLHLEMTIEAIVLLAGHDPRAQP